MDNATRRQLLQRHRQSGFPGSILDVYRAYNQGVDLIGQFEQQNNIQVATTPEQFQQGLRPAHQAGDINRSMVFPDVPPNTPFNTMGMKAPINIQKFDEQGHLVKSYENVPPGIRSLPTGPQRGTVIETPAKMQDGGVRKYQSGNFVYGDWREVSREVDPITNDIVITEQRDGSRTLEYNKRGVNWDVGYKNWLAQGNTGTFAEFKAKAEAWKKAQAKTEYDTQTRTNRLQNEEEDKVFPDVSPVPTLPPAVNEGLSSTPNGQGVYAYPSSLGSFGQYNTPYSSLSYQPNVNAVLNETFVEDGYSGAGETLSPSSVQSTYNLQSRQNRAGKTKSIYTDDINVTRADGTYSNTRSRQINTSRPGQEDKTRGRSVFEEFDADGNRIVRQVDRFRVHGGVRKMQAGTPPKWDDTIQAIGRNWGPDQLGDTLDLNTLDLISEERMGVSNPYMVRDSMAYHETGPHQRMQPNAVQIAEEKKTGKEVPGVGRGLFMYDQPSTLRDANRLITIAGNMGMEPPAFATQLKASDGTSRADTLSADQQHMLMTANLIADEKAPFKAYGRGDASLEDLWYGGVNRRDEEAKARGEFRESMRGLSQDDLSRYFFMGPKPNYFERRRRGGLRRRLIKRLQ